MKACVIAGHPSSGNNLFLRLIVHLQQEAGYPARARVIHYGRKDQWGMARKNWEERWGLRVLIPRRDLVCVEQSIRRRWVKVEGCAEIAAMERYHLARTREEAGGLETMKVGYERAVADPEGVGRSVADFLELPWAGWPEEVTDRNAKYPRHAADRVRPTLQDCERALYAYSHNTDKRASGDVLIDAFTELMVDKQREHA